jgi:hypothetical protein
LSASFMLSKTLEDLGTSYKPFTFFFVCV